MFSMFHVISSWTLVCWRWYHCIVSEAWNRLHIDMSEDRNQTEIHMQEYTGWSELITTLLKINSEQKVSYMCEHVYSVGDRWLPLRRFGSVTQRVGTMTSLQYLKCTIWVCHVWSYVHSCQQKSIGLKFSKSQTGSDVRYSCHHNSSGFTFPIFAHLCRFSVLHSLQSITPRMY